MRHRDDYDCRADWRLYHDRQTATRQEILLEMLLCVYM